jgi:hypothetical protein
MGIGAGGNSRGLKSLLLLTVMALWVPEKEIVFAD